MTTMEIEWNKDYPRQAELNPFMDLAMIEESEERWEKGVRSQMSRGSFHGSLNQNHKGYSSSAYWSNKRALTFIRKVSKYFLVKSEND